MPRLDIVNGAANAMRFAALQVCADAAHGIFRIEPRRLTRVFFRTNALTNRTCDDADISIRLACNGRADGAAVRMTEHDGQRHMQMMCCVLDTCKLMRTNDAACRADDEEITHAARENRLGNHARIRTCHDGRERLLALRRTCADLLRYIPGVSSACFITLCTFA